jgi:hypothetical protein
MTTLHRAVAARQRDGVAIPARTREGSSKGV